MKFHVTLEIEILDEYYEAEYDDLTSKQGRIKFVNTCGDLRCGDVVDAKVIND